MASQGTQRPRRNASPSSSTKPQPMRATMPFSLSTKRNPNPNSRRQSPASSPVHNEGPLKATRRSSPEIRTSPENRRSPTSPSLLSFGSKVERPKSSIRRTSSLDTLSGSYMSSQWPRGEIPVGFPAAMVCKETQTVPWEENGSGTTMEQPKHQRSASWGSPDVMKERFRQNRQRTKQNRHSPVAADHTAIAHSSSVPIPVVPKPVTHGRCSMEGLNSEIQGLVVTDGDDSVFKTPNEQPDGHRAPVPTPLSSSVDANTQTPGEYLDYHEGNHSIMIDHACQTHSPSTPGESRTPQSAGGRESSSPDVPSGFKYASSPKPNNSYLFGREPPDGAEKVPLHVDEVGESPMCVSGPDKSKGTIKFSKQSPFHFFNSLPSKVVPPSAEHSCIH